MSRNEVFRDADFLSLPVPPGTPAGAPVRVGGNGAAGGLFGVTQTPEGEGGNASGHATVALIGAHTLDVEGVVLGKAQLVYITEDGDLTTTAAGNIKWGYALGTKAAGTGPLLVLVRAS